MISYKKNFKRDIFIVLLLLVGVICSSQAIADSYSKLMTQGEPNIYYVASDVAIGKTEGGDGNVSMQEIDIKLLDIKAKLFTGEYPNSTGDLLHFKHNIRDVYSIIGMIGIYIYECEMRICSGSLSPVIRRDEIWIENFSGTSKAVYRVLVFYQ